MHKMHQSTWIAGQGLTEANADKEGWNEREGNVKVNQRSTGICGVRLDETIYGTGHSGGGCISNPSYS